MEYFFVSTTKHPGSHRVLVTKEDLMNYLSFKLEQCIKNGGTRFDLIIDTDCED